MTAEANHATIPSGVKLAQRGMMALLRPQAALFGLLLTTSWIAPALAAGEFEAALREEFVGGYLSKTKELTGKQPSRPQIEARAKCFTDYILEVFSLEERAALDMATKDNGAIAAPIASKLSKRYMEVAATGFPCNEPAAAGPGAG